MPGTPDHGAQAAIVGAIRPDTAVRHAVPRPHLEAGAESPLRAGGSRQPRAVLGGVILVQLAVLWHFTRESFFVADDFLNFNIAQHSRFGAEYLMKPVFEHFAPGHRLGNYVIQRWFPFDFPLATAVMLVLLAGCVWLLHRILVLLFGDRPLHLLLVFLVGLSVPALVVMGWWAAALHRVPATFGSLVCIHGYLRWYRTGSAWSLFLSVAGLMTGLLFFVKVLLVPLWIAAIRVLFLRSEPRHHRARPAAEKLVWPAYGAVVLAYGANYLANGYGIDFKAPSVDLVRDYLLTAWFRGFVPSLFGLSLGEHQTGIGTAMTVVLTQALVAGLAVVTVARRRDAWRGWLFVGLLFLLNALMNGVPLLVQFGPGLGSDARYLFDYLWFVPLGVAYAWPPSRRDGRPTGAGVVPILMVTLGLCAYAVAFWQSATERNRTWAGVESHRYFSNLRSSLATAHRREPQPVLADGAVPEAIVGAWLAPYNRLSAVFPLFDPSLRFGDLGGRIYLVQADGRLVPAEFMSAAAWPPRAGVDVLRPGHVSSRPRGCTATAGPAVLDFEPSRLLPAEPWQLRLVLGQPGTGRIKVFADSGSGWPGLPDRETLAGPGDRSVDLGPRPPRRLRLEIPPGATACLAGVEVGTFRATTP